MALFVAEAAITSVLSTTVERLSKLLIEEYTELGEAVKHAEWIERELRSMQILVEQVEQRSYNEQEEELKAWAEKLKKTAVDAEDVIETFVINWVRRKKSQIRYWNWNEKRKLCKELVRIRKEMVGISEERRNLSSSSSQLDVTVVTRGEEASSSTTIVAAMKKLDQILSENLFTDDDMELVEAVKDELGYLQNRVSNLNKSTTSCEREKVWLEEVNEVCKYTSGVAESATARKQRWLKMNRLRKFINLYEWRASAREFKQEMNYCRSQIGDALDRNFTYGVGGKHKGGGVANKQTAQISIPVPYFPLRRFIPRFSEDQDIDFVNIVLSYVDLSRSLDWSLKYTQRNLKLMSAFLSDTESVQGLNERQQVWVSQVKTVARNAQSLVDACPESGYLSRIKFAEDINGILKDIISISDRKRIYDIADIEEGRRDQPEVEVRPADAAFSLKVELVREERELMNALFQDVQDTGESDGRSRIWAEPMKVISRLVVSVNNNYDTILEHKPTLIQIPRYFILKYRTRRVINRDINEIRGIIEEASTRGKRYDMGQLQRRARVQILRGRTQPSLVGEGSDVIGFDDDVELLMSQLLSDEKRRWTTCIVGIGGIGKTTLANLIYKHEAVVGHFERRVWVSVSDSNCNAQQVVEEIANKVMRDSSTHHPLQTLACEKYLIVIDGVESCQSYLDFLNIEIPDRSTASRLVLTTRNYSEAATQEYSDTSSVHPLQLLDDKSSWVLCKRHLKKVDKDNIPPQLLQCGKEIVKKCGGLPLQILNLSRLLSTKHVSYEEWSTVLSHYTEDPKHWLEKFYTINNLPLYLRRCLFYLEHFPAEFAIPVRRLVVLWVAEGLVQGVEEAGEVVPPERVAERYLTELIDRNIVQTSKRKRNGEVKACRLPSPLRQLWLPKADNESKITRRVVDRLDQNDIWHNDIHGSASLNTQYKDVISFLSFDVKEEGSKPGEKIGKFLSGCIESNCFLLLRVLDLERVYRPNLPKTIARLSQLRYLGLRWTYLESLPSSIDSLLKLQTLDLKHTYIHTLPTSIWNMYLRHLFLSETFRTKFPPQKGNTNYLSHLQTLSGLFVDEDTPLKGGLDTLVNITRLGLACQSMSSEEEEEEEEEESAKEGPLKAIAGWVIMKIKHTLNLLKPRKEKGKPSMKEQLEAIANWIMKLEHLQSLTLKSRKEDGKPSILYLNSFKNNINLTDMYLLGSLSSSSVLRQFPSSLVELTLSHSKLEDDPMQILKSFQNLRILSLLAESYIGTTMSCESKSFPQLRVLKLWKLENLEEWKIEKEALPYLRQLEIRSCPRITKLPIGLQHVSTLLELKLTNMPILVNAYMRGDHKIPPNCQLVPLPSLQ